MTTPTPSPDPDSPASGPEPDAAPSPEATPQAGAAAPRPGDAPSLRTAEPAAAQPGTVEPAAAQPATAQPGPAQSGVAQPNGAGPSPAAAFPQSQTAPEAGAGGPLGAVPPAGTGAAWPVPGAEPVPGPVPPVAWQGPGSFTVEPAGPPARTRPNLWGEGLLALGVAAWLTVIGFPLGWLWSAIAPWTPVQMTPDGAILSQPEQEQMIADEGWYLLITVVAGLVMAALAWALLRRYRGVPMVLGLAVGGLFGGVLTWWFGHNLGLDHFRRLLEHAPNGTNFGAPVNLRVQQVGLWHGWLPYARGDVLALAIAGTALYLLLTGFSSYPSLRGPDPVPPAVPGFYPPANGYLPGPGAAPTGPEPGTGNAAGPEPGTGNAAGPEPGTGTGVGPGAVPLSSDS